MTDTKSSTAPSSAISIALAWLVVLVPAAWGVYFTSLSAAKLFQ